MRRHFNVHFWSFKRVCSFVGALLKKDTKKNSVVFSYYPHEIIETLSGIVSDTPVRQSDLNARRLARQTSWGKAILVRHDNREPPASLSCCFIFFNRYLFDLQMEPGLSVCIIGPTRLKPLTGSDKRVLLVIINCYFSSSPSFEMKILVCISTNETKAVRVQQIDARKGR